MREFIYFVDELFLIDLRLKRANSQDISPLFLNPMNANILYPTAREDKRTERMTY